ncbi:MAG: hypothetical protein ABSH48_21195 [Verrucomicrobiota bacterium]|jgi:hypothetical protein
MKNYNYSLFRKTTLFALALCTTTILLVSCGKSPSWYLGFTGQSQAYYAAIAQACGSLLSPTNHISGEQIFSGDDKSLPTALLNLHATTIKVANRLLMGTNYVSGVTIIFGEGRPDFTAAWYQNDYGNGNCPWELAVNGDGPHTVVFSTNLVPSAPTVPPSSQANEPGH